MPCYLFHVFNHDRTVDAQGKVLADLDAARAVAVEGARSIMADELRTEGRIDLSDWIEIEDENGDMTVVKFGDAVKVEAREIVDLLTRNAAILRGTIALMEAGKLRCESFGANVTRKQAAQLAANLARLEVIIGSEEGR